MAELQLSWMGDFDLLKQFVSENLELSGEWISPGGDKKTLSDGCTSISWRKNKKVLSIDGKEKNKLKRKLCSVICGEDFEENEGISLQEATTTNDNSPSDYTSNELSTEVEGIKLDVTIVEQTIKFNTHSIRKVESDLVRIDSDYEEIRQQLDKFKKETQEILQRQTNQLPSSFEYSNVIYKDIPRGKKRCHDKATCTNDFTDNNGSNPKSYPPVANSIQGDSTACLDSATLPSQPADYREKHQLRHSCEQVSWSKPKRTRTSGSSQFNHIQDDEIPINKNRFEPLQIISDEESESEFSNPTHAYEDQITAYRSAHKSKHRKTSEANRRSRSQVSLQDQSIGVQWSGQQRQLPRASSTLSNPKMRRGRDSCQEPAANSRVIKPQRKKSRGQPKANPNTRSRGSSRGYFTKNRVAHQQRHYLEKNPKTSSQNFFRERKTSRLSNDWLNYLEFVQHVMRS